MENGIGRNRVVVDEDYALDKMYEDSRDTWEIIEGPVRGLLSGRYESGRESGEKKAEEIERRHSNQSNILDMLSEKAGTNDTKAKIADAGVLYPRHGSLGHPRYSIGSEELRVPRDKRE